eukprot:scaffold654338_cov45-Prasinocladus_malaysianus.AAC.1
MRRLVWRASLIGLSFVTALNPLLVGLPNGRLMWVVYAARVVVRRHSSVHLLLYVCNGMRGTQVPGW